MSNEEVKNIWNTNAEFWDSKMGEGNEFHKMLIEPVQLRLLDIQPGQRILDLACGNGQFARKMAELGANVTATDFSEKLLAIAKAKGGPDIRYQIADMTKKGDLAKLADKPYDAVVCTMALMDVSDIKPLASYLPKLLKHGGRFVFSQLHPCFNSGTSTQVQEVDDLGGEVHTRFFVKVSDYLTEKTTPGFAMLGQPQAQYYFHRPISLLLGTFFQFGLVLDAIEEPSFANAGPGDRLFLNVFRNIPPALVCRLHLR
jgi:2-polyprenyl-3-methyl-5-hydroxy-6-metoxy-1,4-benzoquinol methylase